MAQPVITRCRIENLPIMATLDRACFEAPLPGDDFCDYLKATQRDESVDPFFAIGLGTRAARIALLLSIFDSLERLQPIGFLLLVLREELGLIERIGLHPEHQGKGLARFFVEHVQAEARRLGVTVWGAEIPKSNLAGQQFFQHLGFLNSCPATIQPFQPQESSTILLWR